MKVFWSWQSDYSDKCNKRFIRDALVEAVSLVGQELDVSDADRPTVDQDTSGVAGMADISAAIFDKIKNAAVFVADVTPIAKSSNDKALPNPNVLLELGYALHNPGQERVIAVINTASGYKQDDLPFDLRGRRIIAYHLADDADKDTIQSVRKDLVKVLKGAISTNLKHHLTTLTPNVFSSVAAQEGDSSIWSGGNLMEVQETQWGQPKTLSLKILDGPRSYTRLIPEGWNASIPGITQIIQLTESERIWPMFDAGGSGSHAHFEDGTLFYWLDTWDGDLRQARNVTAFFEATGEFWILHGGAIHLGGDGIKYLNVISTLNGWFRAMMRGCALLKKLRAKPTLKIELGLNNIKGITWVHPNESGVSRKNFMSIERVSSLWDDHSQQQFLMAAYNKLRDCFTLPAMSEEQFSKLYARLDRS